VYETTLRNVDLNILVRIAALISCGLGISALPWSIKNLAPLLVEFQDRQFLALAPLSAASTTKECKFFLAEAGGFYGWNQRWELLCQGNALSDGEVIGCLFPPDIRLEPDHYSGVNLLHRNSHRPEPGRNYAPNPASTDHRSLWRASHREPTRISELYASLSQHCCQLPCENASH
jgi:hypothetical protein